MASPSDRPRSMNRRSKHLLLAQVAFVFVLGVGTTLCQLRSSSQTLFGAVVVTDNTDAPLVESNDNSVSLLGNNNVTIFTGDVVAVSSNSSNKKTAASMVQPATDLVEDSEKAEPPRQTRSSVVSNIVEQNRTVPLQQKQMRTNRNNRRRPNNNNRRKRRRNPPQTRESLNVSNLTLEERTRLAHSLRLKKPIFAAGLPKTGTTSLHKYFLSVKIKGTFRSSHTYTQLQNGTTLRAGACMQQQFLYQKPMLRTCGRFQVWSDSGYALGGDCFYPLWHALDNFVRDYPTATIILNTRNATEWTNSIQKWGRGSLAKRWTKCRNGLQPELPRTLDKREWMHFYEAYHTRIRQACKQHSTLNCIEFDIGNPNAGKILEQEFGIPASHWRNCNPFDWSCKNHTSTSFMANSSSTSNVTIL